MNKNDITKLGITYYIANGFLFTLFIVTVLNLTYLIDDIFPFLRYNFGINFFYFLGILIYYTYPFAFLFILISSIHLYRLNITKSVKFGIIGVAFYIVTITFFNIVLVTTERLELVVFIIFWSGISIIDFFILYFLKSKKGIYTAKDESFIRKIVLDLGTRFTRLEVREISEKCSYDSDLIVKVLNKMINNNEIYAEYFQSTKTVVFDQKANIEEIDKLMAVFEEWEKEQYGKQD